MGSLRFLLACVVLLSHLGVRVYGLNPGVTAVVIFYLLAGHVVAGLWGKWCHQPNALVHFYKDRFFRIAPQYAMAMMLSALLWLNGASSPFISVKPTILDWMSNIFIIPLNYYMYTGQDGFTLIPPAWSLATEVQFYLLAPLLLMSKTRLMLKICFGLSILIFTLAQAQCLSADYFGYRLLPGILFIFLIGVLQEQRLKYKNLTEALVALWLLNVYYFFGILMADASYVPFRKEVSLGLMLAMPLLLGLSTHKITSLPVLGRSLDKNLGALSYGVFLYHFPVMWSLKWEQSGIVSTEMIIVAILTVSVSAFGHWCIERPLWKRFR